jgi:hypothetical protein
VVRLYLLHGDALFRRFVSNVLEQASERLYVMPLRFGKLLSNIGQVLEHDYVAFILDGFRDDLGSGRVDVLFAPRFFALPEANSSDSTYRSYGVGLSEGSSKSHSTRPLIVESETLFR